MVEEFIRKRGVTPCPSSGSPELAALHIERERDRGAVYSWGGTSVRRKRRSLK